jgi:malonyl-CoA O-methyltransferase
MVIIARELPSAERAADEFAPRPGFLRRLADAAGRRLKRPARPGVEEAHEWLAYAAAGGGVQALPGGPPCAATTGQAVVALVELGQLDAARDNCSWLIAFQDDCGALSDESGRPSIFHTGQAARGMLAWLDDVQHDDQLRARLERAVTAACDWLVTRIDADGELDRSAGGPGSIDRFGPTNLGLACLPPLSAAADRFGRPYWREAAQRALRSYLRRHDATRWEGPLHWWLHGVESLIDLGELELAELALLTVAARQSRCGDVPASPDEGWISSAGQAQFALACYRLDLPRLRRCADRALTSLRRQQNRSGGFFGSWDRGAEYFRDVETTAAAVYFLRAAAAQVRCAFASHGCDFPGEIDDRDGRWQAVRAWRAGLPTGARIADIGCGKGRYLKRLCHEFPGTRAVGVDVDRPSLAQLPRGVEPRLGSQLHVPAASGEFDGAICIEALEHSLLPRQAVAELCRVVRPGGGVLVIDKARDKQRLSRHEPWERWFSPGEVSGWLAEHCDNVVARPVAHGTSTLPSGLFYCWTGRRRAAALPRAA